MPLIYSYDQSTGQYIDSREAFPNPMPDETLENPVFPGDAFLLPAHATPVEPPEIPEGKMAVFVNGEWELQTAVTAAPVTLMPTKAQLMAHYNEMITNLQAQEPPMQEAITAAENTLASADQSDQADYEGKQVGLMIAQTNLAALQSQITTIQNQLQQQTA